MVEEFFLIEEHKKLACACFDDTAVQNLCIFFCGLGQTKNETDYFFPELAKKLLENGISSSLMFDFYGHGESNGSFEEVNLGSLIDDSEIVMNYAFSNWSNHKRIHLIGKGIGSYVMNRLTEEREFGITSKIHISPYVKSFSLDQFQGCRELVDVEESICSGTEESFCSFFALFKDLDYEDYFDTNNLAVLWVSNLGGVVENLRGMKISKRFLNELQNLSFNFDGRGGTRELVIFGENDPRIVNSEECLSSERYSTVKIKDGDMNLVNPQCRDDVCEELANWLLEL